MTSNSLSKSVLLTLVALLLGVCPLWAQYNLSHGAQFTDYTIGCASTNCWYALPGSGFIYVSVGADGEMWANKADDTIYRWNGSGWTLKSNGRLSQISVGSASQIWGLTSDHRVWQWNGTSWVQMTGLLSYISAAADGTVLGVSSNRQVWQWNGSGWTLLTGALDEVSVGGQYAIYGRSGTGVFTYVNSGWVWLTSAPAASDIAANPDGGLWIRGTNQTAYYSSDLSTWTGMNGLLNNLVLASGGKYLTVTVGGGGILYHLNNRLPSVGGSISGNYATFCNNHPNGCPQGSVHTVTYQASFYHGLRGGQGSAQGVPGAALNAVSDDIASPTGCDLLFGDPNSAECKMTETGSATCSKMGNLGFAGSLFGISIAAEACFTAMKNMGQIPGSCVQHVTGGPHYCRYNFSYWCANTANPDWQQDVPYIEDLQLAGDRTFGWTTGLATLCFRLNGGPWLGGPSLPPILEHYTYFAPVQCTYNP